MRRNEFEKWLKTQGYRDNVVRSRLANCEKVKKFEGDLDLLYEQDCCYDLLERLSYSSEDERRNLPTKHKIPIEGNKRTGSATLKQAVNLYIKFINNEHFVVKSNNNFDKKNNQTAQKTMNSWPAWEQPSEQEIYEMAQIITKYIKFLSPDIVNAVVKENKRVSNEIYKKLKSLNIMPELYIWENCSCAFPGIRRYSGSSEISAYRKQSIIDKIEDAIQLDDNDFPKQIWSFVFRGTQFNKRGPEEYSLAHLVDHKKDNNRMQEEFIFEKGHYNHPYYGLYTCASNSIYIPNKLMKPTDFNGFIRNLIFRKAESLYGDFCNLVPPNVKVIRNSDPRWNICEFEWADPVGDTTNINAFFEFRKRKFEWLK